MAFSIYKHTFELDGDKYTLRPLSGEHIDKVLELMTKLDKGNKDEEQKMDASTLKLFREIAFETFKKSYPEQSAEVLDEFVSQNVLRLLEPIIEVNIKGVKK